MVENKQYPHLAGQKVFYAYDGDKLTAGEQLAELEVNRGIRVLFHEKIPDDLLHIMWTNDCSMAIIYQGSLSRSQAGTILEVNVSVVGNTIVVIQPHRVLTSDQRVIYHTLEVQGIPVVVDDNPILNKGLHTALNLLNSKLAGV